ncbi:helix-turn-helix transcriptional regulator [Enteractinococcus coprophilus]
MSGNPITVRRLAASDVLDNVLSQGGGTVLVDGLAGMGKTYFLRELAQQARHRELWPVTFLAADRIERGEPYSFIERFLAAGFDPDWDFETESKKQPLSVARSCVRHLLDATGPQQGHIILIDDAHWIDDESTRVLRHLIPRVNRRNIAFVLSARTPHEPSSIGQFLAESAAANPQDLHIEIGPLQETEIRALAMDRFGMMISPNNAAELQRATGGAFIGVDSIFSQVTPEEVKQLHRTWEFPIRDVAVQNPLLSSFYELDLQAQTAAQIVCLAQHELPREMLLAALEQLGLPNKIRGAIQAGVIRESGFGRSIVPKHDLIASAVRSTVEPPFRRRVHRVLAELTDGYRSVRHMFMGAESWNETLEARVEDYVTEATELGQFDHATEILRMGLDLAENFTVRQRLITDLVLISIRAKSGYRCLDLLSEIESFPHSMLREFLALLLRIYLIDEPYPEDRAKQVLESPSETPDETALQGYLSFTLIVMMMRSPDRRAVLDMIPMARDFIAKGPQDPEELLDRRFAWMVAPEDFLVHLDCLELIQWNLDGRHQDVRRKLPDMMQRVAILPPNGTKIDCLTMLAGLAMALGQTVRAHDMANQAIELLDRGTLESWSNATPRIIQAHCFLLFGKYNEASKALDHFEEISHHTLDLEARLTGAALRAKIMTITQQSDPEPYISQAMRIWDFAWEHYGRDLSVMAKLEYARATGDDQAILEITSRPEVRNIGTTIHGFLTFRVHCLIDAGELDEAEQLIDELSQRRGTTWFEHWGTLDWLKARLAQAHGRLDVAQQHYKAALKHQTYPLTWALTNRDYGVFLFEQHDFEKAETMLRQAVTTLEDIGATAYLPAARKELDTAIEQNRQSRKDVLTSMTQREREVAELLADGHSNRSIAERLVVSQSTARFHVSNILRKLQLTSRAEVATLFHESQRARASEESATD